jgi:hypothetical protein
MPNTHAKAAQLFSSCQAMWRFGKCTHRIRNSFVSASPPHTITSAALTHTLTPMSTCPVVLLEPRLFDPVDEALLEYRGRCLAVGTMLEDYSKTAAAFNHALDFLEKGAMVCSTRPTRSWRDTTGSSRTSGAA